MANQRQTLQEDIKRSEEALDQELAKDETPTEEIEVTDKPEEVETTETTQDEVIDETPTEETETTTSEPEDNVEWKKRYADSSREAKVLSSKNKELNGAIDEAATLTLPTDEEAKQEYSEWDDMTPTEQRLAKDNLLNKKRFELVHGATQKFKNIEEWDGKVDVFIENPKTLNAHPELEGKQDEFKIFASKSTRRGVDFEDLVLAFIGEESKRVKNPNKGKSMFPAGTGGSNAVPKPPSNKISLAQATLLRQTNYSEYRRKLKANEIEMDILDA